MSDSEKQKGSTNYKGPKRQQQNSKTKPPRPAKQNPKPPKKE
jgi:hypothetical protein